MRSASFRRDVNLLSIDDFLGRFPHYSAVRSAERGLFDLLNRPESVVRAEIVSDALGLPAVSGVAHKVGQFYASDGELTGFRKQLCGAIICALMEANGYARTGRKKSVSHAGWSRAEVYERA